MPNDKMKENIIKWYPFKPDATILKIEKSIEDIEEKQFDYVTLIGTLQYAHKLFDGVNPEQQLIEYAKQHLKEDGKILIAIDNEMGIKNFCEVERGKKENHKLTRKKIENLLKKCGLNYYKFYYPLPNYETTNVVFTDEFLPNQETITRNISLHEEDSIVINVENEMFLNILAEDRNLFKIFANSYFIECSTKELKDNQIQLISYSNMRKPEYEIKTIIQGDKVYKTEGTKQAKEHIENIKRNIDILNELGFNILDYYEENTIISQYQKNRESVDHVIINKIKNGEKEEAVQLMMTFFQEIKDKLITAKSEKNIFDTYQIQYEPSQIENFTFTKYGLWDLIFQNAFYIDNKFFFYDQEWMDEGVPIEYIWYRSIMYTRELMEIFEGESMWQKLGITEENIQLFKQLDNKIQEKIRDAKIWEKHITIKTIEDIEAKFKQENEKMLEEFKKLLNEKDARIAFLEKNMEETVKILKDKEKIIENMENSLSWKVTKPLRNIRKKGEKNEN